MRDRIISALSSKLLYCVIIMHDERLHIQEGQDMIYLFSFFFLLLVCRLILELSSIFVLGVHHVGERFQSKMMRGSFSQGKNILLTRDVMTS